MRNKDSISLLERLEKLRTLLSQWENPHALPGLNFPEWQGKVYSILSYSIGLRAEFQVAADVVYLGPEETGYETSSLKIGSVLYRAIAELEDEIEAEQARPKKILSIGKPSKANLPHSGNDSNHHAPLAYTLDVFISHSSKDADISELLIEFIRAGLDVPNARIRCTSVDGYRLPTGASTDDQIKQEVRESRCFIAILTPSSLTSSYVLFELGARWGAGLPLFPLLARGSVASDLGAPLSSLNAVSCYTAAQLHQILADLGKILGKQPNSAATYDKHLQRLIRAAEDPSDVAPSNGGNSPSSDREPLEPDNSAAKELLELILQESDLDSRGIVKLGATMEPGQTYFFPRIQYAGSPKAMKSRIFRDAISELIERKWLYPPEYNETTNSETFEFRAQN